MEPIQSELTLLNSKLFIPQPLPELVDRPELNMQLNDGPAGKLILVIDPARYRKITRLITLTFLNTIKMPFIKIAVPDATDMPANCKGFAKKNAHALQCANARRCILLKEQLKAKGLRRAVRALTLLDIRSIHYAFG